MIDKAPPPSEEHVLDAEGHFHASDEPVDLSGYGWEDWLTLGFFWLMAVAVFYQFFTRYVFADSAAWTEEIARYLSSCLLRWRVDGGAQNTQIHVEFLYRWLPAPVGRALSTFVDVVRFAFLAYATYLTVLLIPKMQNLKMTVVDFPMSYIYGLVGLGFGMMTVRSIQVGIRHWKQGWSVLERPGEAEA